MKEKINKIYKFNVCEIESAFKSDTKEHFDNEGGKYLQGNFHALIEDIELSNGEVKLIISDLISRFHSIDYVEKPDTFFERSDDGGISRCFFEDWTFQIQSGGYLGEIVAWQGILS